ncbi:hypothetical protein U879_08580 [Defluviimonas sp. 20V17]|uniref:Uncharacterized protein n=1 Tax=Allgaiera indica TaxID=765699 RepID=A0AAN4UNH5_9RHOB|nr:hypothetical protein [Allgaiera indica]KDB04101.1 hypothetical protein U879_08580 [Defluviimonas sp. 20V17]GHD98543.1 hypothetical protein GCM10008024_02480 [Allgaiera indica]SDW11392.1 hypothetical protein SAMN05444006_101299 [Allgaiera indica]
MPKLLKTLIATIACLVLLDAMVAVVLALPRGRSGPVAKLAQFFDYGYSVPGKLTDWIARPGAPGNLFDVAWRQAMMRKSAERFAREDPHTPEIRGYSMSFVNHVLEAAKALDPGLVVDLHAGPAAPPNATFAMFLDDRANRRKGDVVVFGILSSSVPGMGALSNQTWMFEQPSPFTYPVFLPAPGGGLTRIEPLMESAAQERANLLTPSSPGARAWRGQLRRVDAFYGPETFGLPWLDASPFARLVRRSIAVKSIAATKQRLLADPFGAPLPYGEILRRMVREFAMIARADGQIPVVVLVQVRGKPDLAALLKPTLRAERIRYVATVDHQDPTEPEAYTSDGHYTPEIRVRFGQAFLKAIGR